MIYAKKKTQTNYLISAVIIKYTQFYGLFDACIYTFCIPFNSIDQFCILYNTSINYLKYYLISYKQRYNNEHKPKTSLTTIIPDVPVILM